jgi:hypothetical protein
MARLVLLKTYLDVFETIQIQSRMSKKVWYKLQRDEQSSSWDIMFLKIIHQLLLGKDLAKMNKNLIEYNIYLNLKRESFGTNIF